MKRKHMENNTVNETPWYQEKWVWLIIAIPTMSVCLGIVLITLAVGGRDSLVKDDYYKEGRMINFELEKDQRAKQLDLSAQVMINNQQIAITLEGNTRFERPSMVRCQLIHPTLADTDLDFMLIQNGATYIGELPTGASGRRYIHLTDQASSWRLKGETWLPTTEPILLLPSVPEDE